LFFQEELRITLVDRRELPEYWDGYQSAEFLKTHEIPMQLMISMVEQLVLLEFWDDSRPAETSKS
jgi:hypothetical protein